MNRQLILLASAAVIVTGGWYMYQNKKSNLQVEEPAKVSTENNTEEQEPKKATENTVDAKASFPDGHQITLNDIQKAITELPQQVRKAPFDKIFEAVLSRLVDQHILSKAAESKGFDQNPKVQKQIKDASTAIIQKAELERRVEAMITPDQKQKKYEELMSKVNKDEQEIAFRMIPFKDANDAQSALEQIKAGSEKFDNIFQKSGGIRGGGERGYARSQELPEALWKALSATKSKELASSVVSAEGANWIIMVDDKRQIVLPKLSEVEKEIVQLMTPEYAVEALKTLRKEMPAKRFDVNGKELPPESDAADQKAPDPNAKPIDLKKLDTKKVLAEFEGGATITLQDVLDMRDSLPDVLKNQPLTEEMVTMLLDRLLDMRRLGIAAEKSKVAESTAVQQRLKDIKPMITQKNYLEGVIEEYLQKNPTAMKESYEAKKRLWPADEMEARLRVILMESPEAAQSALADIRSGKVKWEDAVNQHSIDDAVKSRAGDIGYVQRRSLPEDFANIVFKAPKATLLPDVIKLADKVAIVRVEDKRPVTPPSFDEMAPNIKREIDAKVAMEHLAKLRKESGVKAFDMDGKPLDLEAVAQRMRVQMEQMLKQQQPPQMR